MKEFFLGLLVLLSLLLLSIIAIFLMPLILVLGVFLQSFIYLAFVIFSIWLIGKVTLWGIERGKRRKIEIVSDEEAAKSGRMIDRESSKQ